MNTISRIKADLSMTQVELARITGRHQATVSRWESGESVPNIADMQKLRAEFLRRGLEWSDEYWAGAFEQGAPA